MIQNAKSVITFTSAFFDLIIFGSKTGSLGGSNDDPKATEKISKPKITSVVFKEGEPFFINAKRHN